MVVVEEELILALAAAAALSVAAAAAGAGVAVVVVVVDDDEDIDDALSVFAASPLPLPQDRRAAIYHSRGAGAISGALRHRELELLTVSYLTLTVTTDLIHRSVLRWSRKAVRIEI